MSSSFVVRVVDSVEGGVVSSWMISVVEKVMVAVSVLVSVVEKTRVVLFTIEYKTRWNKRSPYYITVHSKFTS